MWFQRVVFNVQTRLLGREKRVSSVVQNSQVQHPERRSMDRVRLVQDRLLDLDRRLEALR